MLVKYLNSCVYSTKASFWKVMVYGLKAILTLYSTTIKYGHCLLYRPQRLNNYMWSFIALPLYIQNRRGGPDLVPSFGTGKEFGTTPTSGWFLLLGRDSGKKPSQDFPTATRSWDTGRANPKGTGQARIMWNLNSLT